MRLRSRPIHCGKSKKTKKYSGDADFRSALRAPFPVRNSGCTRQISASLQKPLAPHRPANDPNRKVSEPFARMQRFTAILLTLQLLAFAGGSALGLHVHCSLDGSIVHFHAPGSEDETQSQPAEVPLEHLFENGALAGASITLAHAPLFSSEIGLAPPVARELVVQPVALAGQRPPTNWFSIPGGPRAPPRS